MVDYILTFVMPSFTVIVDGLNLFSYLPGRNFSDEPGDENDEHHNVDDKHTDTTDIKCYS